METQQLLDASHDVISVETQQLLDASHDVISVETQQLLDASHDVISKIVPYHFKAICICTLIKVAMKTNV